MVEDRIRNIEAHIQASGNLPESAKGELLQLLEDLRGELQGVNKEHLEKAEASGAPRQGGTLDDEMGGLTGTVTELEAMHPRLSELANRLAVALSNMGI